MHPITTVAAAAVKTTIHLGTIKETVDVSAPVIGNVHFTAVLPAGGPGVPTIGLRMNVNASPGLP